MAVLSVAFERRVGGSAPRKLSAVMHESFHHMKGVHVGLRGSAAKGGVGPPVPLWGPSGVPDVGPAIQVQQTSGGLR